MPIATPCPPGTTCLLTLYKTEKQAALSSADATLLQSARVG